MWLWNSWTHLGSFVWHIDQGDVFSSDEKPQAADKSTSSVGIVFSKGLLATRSDPRENNLRRVS